ncbi:MAG TPA: hypothetical protein VF125_06340 [Solirubrobacterales bacterium]
MKHLDGVLRALSLVVTDRRWAAPLSAMALGFGLFLGVAIGPGAAGSLATGAGQVIAVAPSSEDGESEPATAAEPAARPEPASAAPPEAESLEPEFAEPALLPEPSAEPAPEAEEPPAEEPASETETGETQQLKGTVVHANPVAGSYAMAIAGGELVSVHAAKLPTPGEKLTVEAEPLDNNTFAEEAREKTGATAQATARGVVTFVDADPLAPAYTLSGRGSSILVHLPVTAADQLPGLGAYATVGIGIEPPQSPSGEPPPPTAAPEPAPACAPDPGLQPPPAPRRVAVQRSLEAEPEPATYLDLAGVVTGICPATGQLLLSADDLRSSEADLLLAVPAKIRLGALEVGESIVATATVAEDGALTLTGLAGDEGRKGAEDPALAQGDLKR